DLPDEVGGATALEGAVLAEIRRRACEFVAREELPERALQLGAGSGHPLERDGERARDRERLRWRTLAVPGLDPGDEGLGVVLARRRRPRAEADGGNEREARTQQQGWIEERGRNHGGLRVRSAGPTAAIRGRLRARSALQYGANSRHHRRTERNPARGHSD